MDNCAITIESVHKTFNSVAAVDDVSFEVKAGEVFGLLGPNGAGKTTLIRLIMDILRPDSGSIQVLGKPTSQDDKSQIGYLPEERGLYTRQRVLPVVEYFARLKGLSQRQAHVNALHWLEELGMTDTRERKIQELSKGNQQKIQLIATIVANPEVLILDEPFAGLDPVNVRLVITVIRSLANSGKTVLLSTHQMALVESLCQRVFMMNRGRRVLYGSLEEVRQQYSGNAVLVRSNADYSQCPLVARFTTDTRTSTVNLQAGARSCEFLAWLSQTGAEVDSFEKAVTPLEDIFIKLVEENR